MLLCKTHILVMCAGTGGGICGGCATKCVAYIGRCSIFPRAGWYNLSCLMPPRTFPCLSAYQRIARPFSLATLRRLGLCQPLGAITQQSEG